MLFIEAKTAKLHQNDKEQDVLNKIGNLGRFATGKFGKLLLVSARILSPEALDRARVFDIDVLHGPEIIRLGDYIRVWMRGKKLSGLSA